jgi:polar amino acid transport system substrate-binding protein
MEVFEKLGARKAREDLKLLPWARGYQAALKEPGTALFSMTYSEERQKLFKLVGPIVPTRVSLIARKSRRLKVESVADMNALKIGVIRDDIGDQLVRALGVDEGAILSKASVDNLVRMLYRDRLDAIAYAEDIARYQSRLAGLEPSECEPIYVLKQSHMGYAFHLSADPATLEVLQKALDELREDGTVDRIRDQYLK